jgi:ComF family protein
MKYKFSYDLAEEIAALVVGSIKKVRFPNSKPILLVPIPMQKKRENWRGFNQAEKIGKIVAKNMRWEFEPEFLLKSQQTKPQTGLGKTQREENMQNSFRPNPVFRGKYRNHIPIIFDDVITTGATLTEAGRTLRNRGIKQIYGIVIAG